MAELTEKQTTHQHLPAGHWLVCLHLNGSCVINIFWNYSHQNYPVKKGSVPSGRPTIINLRAFAETKRCDVANTAQHLPARHRTQPIVEDPTGWYSWLPRLSGHLPRERGESHNEIPFTWSNLCYHDSCFQLAVHCDDLLVPGRFGASRTKTGSTSSPTKEMPPGGTCHAQRQGKRQDSHGRSWHMICPSVWTYKDMEACF